MNETECFAKEPIMAKPLIMPNLDDYKDRILSLEAELANLHNVLKEKQNKCNQLEELQKNVDSEVQELTEQLFQEAYRMVNSAEEKRMQAEILLEQSQLKVLTLNNEVEALKSIIKTIQDSKASKMRQKDSLPTSSSTPSLSSCPNFDSDSHILHIIDPTIHHAFIQWRQNMCLDTNSTFLKTIITEDVNPCLSFANSKISIKIYAAIISNVMDMEACSDENGLLRKCALINVEMPCPFKLRLSPEQDWMYISILARNRIAAVCDFFTYLRYLIKGIVKSSVTSVYKEIIHLRKNMMMARLGLQFVSQIIHSNKVKNKEYNISYV
uniref:Sec2p domain-containing protein n=1 Tax=Rhabditophanes sp. KR3021 TaxID=114890 RepID=A0AC35U8H5_9BILA